MLALLNEIKRLDSDPQDKARLDDFLQMFAKLKKWNEILKILSIFHLAIAQEARLFTQEFQLHEFKNIDNLTEKNKDSSNKFT